MNIKNLKTSQETALNAYRLAKSDWIDTITKENIHGDFEKWKIVCEAKAVCMRLGCRI